MDRGPRRPHWRESTPARYGLTHLRIALVQLWWAARNRTRFTARAAAHGITMRELAKVPHLVDLLSVPADEAIAADATFNMLVGRLMLQRPTMGSIARLSDKLEVKDFIAERLMGQSLTGIASTPRVLEVFPDARSLRTRSGARPIKNPVVLKVSHDSGGVWLLRTEQDWRRVINSRAPQRRVRRTYGFEKGEWNYSLVRPRLFIEEFIPEAGGVDFKVHCTQGVPHMIQVIWDRGRRTKETIVGMDGHTLGLHLDHEMLPADLPEHTVSGELLERFSAVASALSEGFPYVRVDLMVSRGHVWVGELTFFPKAANYRTEDAVALGRVLREGVGPSAERSADLSVGSPAWSAPPQPLEIRTQPLTGRYRRTGRADLAAEPTR